MVLRTIEVTVSPTGEVHLETKGYAGGECVEASKFLERALGIVSADCKTSDYYRMERSEQQIVQ